MARQAVLTLGEEFACQPRDLHVALGPCIGRCCFEVGPEVAELFAAALPAAHACGVILQVPGGKAHVDLRLFQRMQFEAAGVPSEQIDSSPSCTVCDAEGRFYSFRRDGRKTGQAVGFVVRVPERGVIG
jgi:copper oxidase (laccase) domain-containing protein